MRHLVKDGKVLDWKFINQSSGVSAFYVGDYCVGQVFKTNNEWSAVCNDPCRMRSADGFATRGHAAKFILKSQGLDRWTLPWIYCDDPDTEPGIIADYIEETTGTRPEPYHEDPISVLVHSCDGCHRGTVVCHLVMHNLEDQFCYCPECLSKKDRS